MSRNSELHLVPFRTARRDAAGALARRAARVSLWVARASTTVLLWTCVVVLLAAAFGEHLAPSVLGLGGVWSGCLAQTLVIVQRPLLLPADRERVAASWTTATTKV